MDDETTPADEHAAPRPATSSTPWAVIPDLVPRLEQALRQTRELSPEAAQQVEAVARTAGRGSRTLVSGAVGVLPIRGVITPRTSFLSMIFGGGPGLDQLQAALREFVEDDDVGGIVLDIDSPGGSVSLVPETAALIREARQVKPVVAVANTLAGSAAYWLASQADEIVVTPSGYAGSIGALLVHEETSAMAERLGIRTTVISAGRYKTEANGYEPLSDEARAALQTTVDDAYALFVDDVAAGRGTTAAAVRSGYGEGRVLSAERAVDAGLVDRIETLGDAIGRVARGDVTSSSSAKAAAPAVEPAAVAAVTPDPNHVLATLLGGRSNRRGITTP
jgi:signal peptide peptidase SppA